MAIDLTPKTMNDVMWSPNIVQVPEVIKANMKRAYVALLLTNRFVEVIEADLKGFFDDVDEAVVNATCEGEPLFEEPVDDTFEAVFSDDAQSTLKNWWSIVETLPDTEHLQSMGALIDPSDLNVIAALFADIVPLDQVTLD